MSRLTRLDGLRGVLAVYVMLGHALPVTALPHDITAPFAHGEAAVDLFFALSGLVIIGSLEHFSCRFWPFILARARRLLPVYFVVLVFAVAVCAAGAPALPWVARDTMAGDIIGSGLPPDFLWHLAAHVALLHGVLPQGVLPFAYVTLLGPAWSLSTEWQFYLLIAVVLPRMAGLARFTILLLLAGVFYHLAAPLLPACWQFSRAFLPDAAPFFALGLASAFWLRGGGARLLVLCLIAACLLGLQSGEPAKALIPLAWALVIRVQAAPKLPFLAALLDSRMAQYFGAISYPLYLVNEPVQRLLMLAIKPFAHGNAAAFSWLWLPLALAVPVAAAALLHHGLEKPMMAAPRSVEDQRAPPAGRRA